MFYVKSFFISIIVVLFVAGGAGAQKFLEQSYYDAEKMAGSAGYSPTSEGNTQSDLIETIMNVVNVILGLIGVVLTMIILWAGWQYMMAGGDQKQIEESVLRIRNAIIGLAIILSAYGITILVFSSLQKSAGG